MRLHRSKWINKFYLRFYQEDYENIKNGCDYFWTLLLALITLPISGSSFILKAVDRELRNSSKLSCLFFRLFVGFGFNFFIVIFILGLITKPLAVLGVIGGIVGVVVLLLGIFALAVWYGDREKKEWESVTIVKEAVKSFKEKYCPKIEWVD